MRPTVKASEGLLNLTKDKRPKVLFRVDGGFGTDANINWLLWWSYQVLAKGYSGKRANKFAKSITDWNEVYDTKWIAPAIDPIKFYRKTKTVVVKNNPNSTKTHHSLIHSSLLNYSPLETVDLYDDRGAMENEIKSDKSGLLLPKRRKKNAYAQEALVLLTDLVHNIVSWTRPLWNKEPALNNRGIEFIINEIFQIPGKVMFQDDKLVKLRLKCSHPLSKPVLRCLESLFREF